MKKNVKMIKRLDFSLSFNISLLEFTILDIFSFHNNNAFLLLYLDYQPLFLEISSSEVNHVSFIHIFVAQSFG